MKRMTAAAALLILMALLAPEPSAADPLMLTGYASAYDHTVMEGVIRHRLDNDMWRNALPIGWYTAAGAIATNDCAQVGLMLTLVDPAGQEHTVLVADCAGRDSAGWMTDNRIIAELDAKMWDRLTTAHGKPLEIGLR